MFNPGSLEACNVDEFDYQRGAYLVELSMVTSRHGWWMTIIGVLHVDSISPFKLQRRRTRLRRSFQKAERPTEPRRCRRTRRLSRRLLRSLSAAPSVLNRDFSIRIGSASKSGKNSRPPWYGPKQGASRGVCGRQRTG
jgi:hypothetical protein